MATISFHKFHGTGNDFILIDDRGRAFPDSKELIEAMCDRHFGIGADGLILLRERKGFDFEMVYFNADGLESTMCGNGGRCIIAFADFLALIGKETKFQAVDGEHAGIIRNRTANRWHVTLKMADVRRYEMESGNVRIDTGSPHFVTFVSGLKDYPVFDQGRKIRYSPPFTTEGINVDFVEKDGQGIFVRTYERGVEDETLSCGTGVTASTLAYALKNSITEGKLDARTLGGQLAVRFRKEGDLYKDVWLEGPAMLSFQGVYTTSGN